MSPYAVVCPFFATRPVVANALSRWSYMLLPPLVLIAIGLLIPIEGGAFGL
ncbi:hypothetical protein ACFYXC_37130 [Streptomyces sp. NPDC002701]|uniref:hypothetical protein n=1 Tax=Streptomyces sp. NPDC002701 TaxID=3364661 RepID=UPI00367BDE5C